MKKFLLLSVLLCSVNSFADQLHSFEQVKNAISAGKSVRFYVDYTKCAGAKQVNMPSFSGAFTPNEIIINNDKGYLVSSFVHFTLNNPQFPRKPIYEFIRYTLANDGSLVLATNILSAPDYSLLSSKANVTCKLDENFTINTQ